MSDIAQDLFNCLKSSNPNEQIEALNKYADSLRVPTNPATYEVIDALCSPHGRAK